MFAHRVRAVCGVLAALAILVACSTASANPAASGPAAAGAAAGQPATPAARPSVSVIPADGTTGVSPTGAVKASVKDGTFSQVTVTANGKTTPGQVSPDSRSWTPTQPLNYGTTYHWSGNAIGQNGAAVPVTGSFTTMTPAKQVRASINIGDGQVLGVGAPIEIQFSKHVTDKAAAQRALQVQTSVPVAGAWAWLPDNQQGSQVHWRPQGYWPEGTTVTVTANLVGVNYGDGAFGRENLTSTFAIGRSQIIKADVNSHRLVVVRDGGVFMDLPASYGLASDPNRVTHNGTHIVLSKSETVLMSNPAYHYMNVPEHWAVRISNNGEFIHANPLTTGVQGSRNVTHGCVNLSTANAKAYYDTALFGDPVEVTGSTVPLNPADGENYDWTIPWAQWLTMSAIPA